MKKFIIILVVLCLVFTLAACKKSVEEKLAEEIAEGIVNELGEENDMSIDSDGDGKITISDGEGQMVIEGSESGMSWPNDKLSKSVPELKGVKVISVASTDNTVLVGFEDCDKNKALEYCEKIKNDGWNVLMELSEADGGMMSTQNDKGETLIFVWDNDENAGTISYVAAE